MFQRDVVEKIKHTFSVQFLFVVENRAVSEIMWKSTVEPDEPQMTIRRMSFARRIIKATDTHSEYVILVAFPRQQWLCERASML
jgi:hypothetical protein